MTLLVLQEPSAEELASMRAAALTAKDNDCIAWHAFCNAECCRMFSLPDKNYDLSLEKIRVFGNATPDIIRYYELHGCKYRTPFLYIPTKNIVRQDGRLYVQNRCSALTDEGKCKYHGTNAKPRVCRELTMCSLRQGDVYGGGRVTPKCLFRFRQEIEEENQHGSNT